MGQFRDYLIQKGLYDNINESPMDIEKQSPTNITRIIKQYMTTHDISEENFERISDNVYEATAFTGIDGDLYSGYDFLFYIENNIILGAAVLKRIIINNGHNKVQAREELYISNFTKEFVKGLAYNLYSAFSKKHHTYIVSGKQQSPENKKVWRRWLTYKENISEVFGYHYKEQKHLDYKQISNYWCGSMKCEERRIVVKFK